jgi:hypothetical protein
VNEGVSIVWAGTRFPSFLPVFDSVRFSLCTQPRLSSHVCVARPHAATISHCCYHWVYRSATRGRCFVPESLEYAVIDASCSRLPLFRVTGSNSYYYAHASTLDKSPAVTFDGAVRLFPSHRLEKHSDDVGVPRAYCVTPPASLPWHCSCNGPSDCKSHH